MTQSPEEGWLGGGQEFSVEHTECEVSQTPEVAIISHRPLNIWVRGSKERSELRMRICESSLWWTLGCKAFRIPQAAFHRGDEWYSEAEEERPGK